MGIFCDMLMKEALRACGRESSFRHHDCFAVVSLPVCGSRGSLKGGKLKPTDLLVVLQLGSSRQWQASHWFVKTISPLSLASVLMRCFESCRVFAEVR